jgi:Short C-terminal domain
MRMTKGSWALVALFLGGGIFFWITQPGIGLGQIWVAVAVFLIIAYVVVGIRSRLNEVSMQAGVRGQAEVLEMTPTGMMVNNQPRVKLKLRVSAPGVAPFEDKRTQTVPLVALGQLALRTPLTVFLQPDKPRKYVIDWSGVQSGDPTTTTTTTPFGSMTVSTQTGVPADTPRTIPDAGAAAAVMAAMKEHGIDPSTGAVDLTKLPAAREAVLTALREHGVDVAHQLAMASPAIPIQPSQEPVERMAKLKQLHDAGLISTEEFDENRKRILGQL